jgi:Tol biopolymer transport system component
MTELREWFRSLDSYAVPDQTAEIEARSEFPPRPSRISWSRAVGRGVLVLVVIAASVAGGYGLYRLFVAQDHPTPGTEVPPTGIVVSITDASRTTLISLDPSDGRTRVIAQFANAASATLSPDGQRIALVRFGESDRGIWVSNLDGTDPVRLTEATSNNDLQPAWSPDGRSLVFGHNQTGKTELFVVDVDGGRMRRLTTNASGQDYRPAWSPDGSSIAFGRDAGLADLWVVDAGGSSARSLTSFRDGSVDEGVDHPAWSPDGKSIAFDVAKTDSGRFGSSADIYMVRMDSGEVTPLVDTPADERAPTWSPDGSKIAFLSNQDHLADEFGVPGGVFDVFVLDVQKGTVERVGGPFTGSTLTLAWRDSSGGAVPVTTTITIDPSAREVFERPGPSADANLTAEEAWAQWAHLNGATTTAIPSVVTAHLGRLTLAPEADRVLAYGFRWRSCPIHMLPSPPPSGPCIEWLFLDANTGKQLDETWQQ